MFLIKSNNNFFLSNIASLLNQKSFPFTLSDSDKSYGVVQINLDKKKVYIKYEQISDVITLPSTFLNIFNKINSFLSDVEIQFDNIAYNPMKETLSFGPRSLKLRNTHNLIFREILKSRDTTIKKNILYDVIWPKDVDVQINKLDTHLTNLKTLLKVQLNYNLNFKSSGGILRFLTN